MMRQKIQLLIYKLAPIDSSYDSLELRITLRVPYAYEEYIKEGLERVLEKSEADFVESLEELLDDIWRKTKGTMLCYTAQPKHPVTLLMCDIARLVREEKQKNTQAKPVIGYLMPGIVKLTPKRPLEDHEDGYPELVELPLKSLLKSHVLSQDGGYLLPVSLLLNQEYLMD